MLEITVPASEVFDEVKNEFISSEETKLRLEHSLVSLSKWESKWEKPFLSKEEKTDEEAISYVECMSLDSNIPPEVFLNLSGQNFRDINKYVEAKMSATWFNEKAEKKGPNKGPVITSELLYYWMISMNIPMACEHWHLSRLFTLIKVCNQKNAPEKKMGRQEMIAHRRKLNAERKAKYNTKG